jgi:hypothetical protein
MAQISLKIKENWKPFFHFLKKKNHQVVKFAHQKKEKKNTNDQ